MVASGAHLFFSIPQDPPEMSSLSVPPRLLSLLHGIHHPLETLSALFVSMAKPTVQASERKQAVDTKGLVKQEPPQPFFSPKCHHLEPQITAEVDGYFIEHWPFRNEKAVQKFRDAGFSRVTCCYYPEALDDRIHFGCRLLTLLFLIDGT